MPVYTVMAEESTEASFRLHNEAVKVAAHALATLERFQSKGFRNIRVYQETREIDLMQLLNAVAAEADAGKR